MVLTALVLHCDLCDLCHGLLYASMQKKESMFINFIYWIISVQDAYMHLAMVCLAQLFV